MLEWIRWKGFFAFICLVILLFFIATIFLDGAVKKMIEATGSELVGAKVELSEAELSFFPLGLELIKLEVTNPDEPMQNIFETSRAILSLDPYNLIMRKIIIKEMAVEDVRFNTSRKTSGAIKTKKDRAPKKEFSQITYEKLPSFELDDIKSILKKEKLITLDEAKTLKKDIQKEKENFNKLIESLPNKKTFKEYQKRIDKIKSGSKGLGAILGKVSEAASLKKDIANKIDQLNKAQKNLKKTLNEYNARIKKISKYPLKDFNRIKNKYSLSPQGLGNLTGLIFGPEYSKWVQKALEWYNKILPGIKKIQTKSKKEGDVEVKPVRGKGVDVHFKEKNPMPDFLIQKAKISMHLESGDVSGTILNITNEQNITQKPIIYDFSGDRLKELSSIKINGTLDHIVPDKPTDMLKAEIKGYTLKNKLLSTNPELPLTIENAIMNLKVNTKIKSPKITSQINFEFNSVSFLDKKGKEMGSIAKAIYSALSDISKFSLTLNIKGTLDNYEVKLSSDLDELLKNSISNIVKQKTAAFEKKLKKEIFAKTNIDLESLQGNLKGLHSIDKELSNRLNIGNDLLGDLLKF